MYTKRPDKQHARNRRTAVLQPAPPPCKINHGSPPSAPTVCENRPFTNRLCMVLFGTTHTAASHRHREHCKLVAVAFEPGNLSKRWRREARAAIVLRELLFTSIYTYWLAGLPNRGGTGGSTLNGV